MPKTTGSFVDPKMERIITVALLDYAVREDAPPADRELAANYAAALQNDTWLLETAEAPDA